MKVCSKCKIEHDENDFPFRDGLKLRRVSNCPSCRKEIAMESYHRNKDVFKLRERSRRLSQKESYKQKKKEYRLNNKEACLRAKIKYIKNNPEKTSAMYKVKYAVKTGKITKQPCGRCQTTIDVQAHHESYDRPLNVTWLCRKHHKERHRELDIMI
jgi:hypothetical protein